MHDATEEYLETILEIEEEGIPPIRARLVERLGISAPAVSETVNRLVDQGYAELLDDRSLHLTPKGRALATTVVAVAISAAILLYGMRFAPKLQPADASGVAAH